jgi:hypothetical protein
MRFFPTVVRRQTQLVPVNISRSFASGLVAGMQIDKSYTLSPYRPICLTSDVTQADVIQTGKHITQ